MRFLENMNIPQRVRVSSRAVSGTGYNHRRGALKCTASGLQSLLFHSFFIICHPYIPLHLEEMIFITCYTAFWLCQCTIYNIGDLHHTCNYHFLLHYLPSLLIPTFPCPRFFCRYAARGDRTRTTPLRRYATNLYAMLHSLVINRA